MDEPVDVPARRGRLHGRLLQVLGLFSAVVTAVALWQFGVFGGDSERDPIGVAEGLDTAWLAASAAEAGIEESKSAASAEPESPSASTEAPASESPSEVPSSEAAATTTPPAEAAQATPSCTANLIVNQQWNRSIDVTVEVVNSGNAEFDSWTIDLGIDDMEIYNYWNMQELDHDWYASENWNGRLDPGEDAVTGFQADTSRGFDLPATVTCEAED